MIRIYKFYLMQFSAIFSSMKNKIPGILISVITAVSAAFISRAVPLGSVTIAIICGIILTAAGITSRPYFASGVSFAEKKILSLSIILMGVNLDFANLADLGVSLIIIIISAILLTISSAIVLGKIMKMDSDLALLIGVGNAVCGSSAIAAVQGVIKAEDDKVGISIAIINFLGTVGIFLLPALISFLPFFEGGDGAILIGNTLQAIGQVFAAGFSIDESTGQLASVVKMGRILMILPVVLIISFFRKENSQKMQRRGVKIPSYILGFIACSALNTLGLLDEKTVSLLSQMSKWLLVTAMAAVGMKITLSRIASQGRKALIMASMVFLFQITYSTMIISLIS